jgi:outer membrane lipoprotein carrier protein
MKKIFIIFISTLILAINVFAQPAGMGKSDPEAKKILDAVSTKFRSFKSVQSKFSLKIENGAGKNLGSKTGTVYMKGTKYRLSLPGQEVFCDGSNVWTLDKSANEVTITRLDPSNNSTITPQKLFTNFYDKDFLYKLNGEAKGMQEIELTPIDKSKPFFKVLVSVNKATKTITSTTVFENTRNKYTYAVNGMKTTGMVSDATFQFNEKNYPGVHVEDLR